MALVLMATHPWGTLWDDEGNVRIAQQASFTTRVGATAVTHYADAAGTGSSTGPVTSDSRGRLMRYVEEGSYNQTINGETLPVEATAGASLLVIKEAPLNVRSDQGGPAVVGDNSDETTKILAKHALLPAAGGEIYYPPATGYRLTSAIPVTQAGVKVIGGGRGRTVIKNAASNVFSLPPSGTTHTLHMEGLTVQAEVGGGHIFEQLGNLSQLHFHDMKMVQSNGAKSIWHMDAVDAFLIESVMELCDLEHVAGATVPAILLKNPGSLNNNLWRKCRCTFSGEYFFWIENTGASAYQADNKWQDINFEVCNGGLINLVNCFGHTLQEIHNWDTSLGGDSTRDFVKVGGGFRSRHTKISGYYRHGGTLGVADTGTGDTTNLSFTVANTAGLTSDCVGRPISGTGIPAGTTVRSLVGAVLTLSRRATATNAGVTLTTTLVDIRLETGDKALKTILEDIGDPDTGDIAVDLGSNNVELRTHTIAALGGETVPSVLSATTITLPAGGSQAFEITGTTNINRIEPDGWAGKIVALRFAGVLTVVDAADNLRITGNYPSIAAGTLVLFCNGVDWYEVERRPRHLFNTATWDPASIADGAMTSTTITVTGAALGDNAFASLSVAVPAGAILGANVTSANTVTVTLVNHTGAPLDLASSTLRVEVMKLA